ncbi:MAG: HAD-IB family phosphatase [Acidobacteriia bacterium]|nr:HAD-IB family phosphatase [Terriglobia bacterium]
MTATSPLKPAEFIDSILRLQPRLAAFDCDGTLWAGDAGEGFFDWELRQRLVSDEIARWARPHYADYRAGKVDEDTMCGEMVTMHRGLADAKVQRAANQYFDENFVGQIFPEMRDLVRRLQQSGCDVWAVSSTNEWVIRAGMKHCGIPENRILAAAVEIENGRITDRLVRVPTGEGKPKAIRDVIRRDPDVAFGNSRWDAEMLAIARHAFAVNPNSELQKIAQERCWPVYSPDSVRP